MDIPSLAQTELHWAPVSEPVARANADETRELVSALKALNRTEMFGEDQELTFVLDRDTQRPVVRLVNRNTQEVIRQIPPDYVLQAAKELVARQKSPPSRT